MYSTKEEFFENFCDWSETICNSKNHTKRSQYSTTRLNNNYDAVLARLFTNYCGPFRTFNITEAIVKVVPFPAVSNGLCNVYSRNRRDDSLNLLLDHYNNTDLHDHLFLSVKNDHTPLFLDRLPSKGPGQVVVPYVNINVEYQTGNLISSMNTDQLDNFFSTKTLTLAAGKRLIFILYLDFPLFSYLIRCSS